jgi:DNA-binding MarR family transcriptional regulator
MDPEDYRRKLLQLTPEGESFCKRLEEMLSTDKEDTSMENEHAQDESEELFALRDSIRGEFSVTQEGHLFIVSASAEDFTGSITCFSFDEAKRVAHCLKIACEMPYYSE